MYLNILDEKRLKLLHDLETLSFITDFEMGGGTALSLQKGLRQSYDFDFFTNKHFNPDVLFAEIKEKFGERAILFEKEDRISTLDLFIDGVKVSFFEYRHPSIYNSVNLDGFKNIKLLEILDIACMKSIAILQRGTRKDFYDLYFIINDENLKPEKLKDILLKKYNNKNVIANFCYSMGYFEDAENDSLPLSFVEYDWDKIKKFFLQYQIKFTSIL